jgi:hypothetical protein
MYFIYSITQRCCFIQNIERNNSVTYSQNIPCKAPGKLQIINTMFVMSQVNTRFLKVVIRKLDMRIVQHGEYCLSY